MFLNTSTKYPNLMYDGWYCPNDYVGTCICGATLDLTGKRFIAIYKGSQINPFTNKIAHLFELPFPFSCRFCGAIIGSLNVYDNEETKND